MRLVYDEASKGHTYTNSRPGQYLTRAHSHITRVVATMDSCFAFVRTHQHGISVGPLNEQRIDQRPFTAEAIAKHSF